MKLADFQIGEKVFVYSVYYNTLTPRTVAKVGRKYITTSDLMRFSYDEVEEFCIRNERDYGSVCLLFKSEEDYKKYCRKKEVIQEFKNSIAGYKLNLIPLETIEKALSILKGSDDNV